MQILRFYLEEHTCAKHQDECECEMLGRFVYRVYLFVKIQCITIFCIAEKTSKHLDRSKITAVVSIILGRTILEDKYYREDMYYDNTGAIR